MYSNKVETLLVNTILNMRKKKLTARSRKRLNILKDHEIDIYLCTNEIILNGIVLNFLRKVLNFEKCLCEVFITSILPPYSVFSCK